MSSHPYASGPSRPLPCSPRGRLVTNPLPLFPVGESSTLQGAQIRPQPKPSKQRQGYCTSLGAVRGETRDILDGMLVQATGNPDAKMCYSVNSFYDEIFDRYGLVLRMWPPHILFANLSSRKHLAAHLRELHQLVKADPPQMFFDHATPSEVRAGWDSPTWICPGTLYVPPIPRHANISMKRRQTTRRVRNGPKSAKVVDEELEAYSSRPLFRELPEDPIVD